MYGSIYIKYPESVSPETRKGIGLCQGLEKEEHGVPAYWV